MIEVCRALGDPVRLMIVKELRGGTRCACVLAEVAGVSPSLLSHHLKTLREVGLIAGERRGRWIDYSLVLAAFEALSETLAVLAAQDKLTPTTTPRSLPTSTGLQREMWLSGSVQLLHGSPLGG